MNPYLLHDLAHERQREAHHRAATARLAAIARCCKPTELSRLLGALRATLAGRPACC
jgi:hypothetical protein